jgi:mRNA-degrading endonuclease toxin of MazEF toxin-antitoxin module
VAFPDPQLGLVISDAYLWHHEHRSGRDEGAKNRPCVIVLALRAAADGTITVRVAPVTHRRPDASGMGFEIPQAVKRYLGFDGERSWIVVDEVNEFAWPGFDLRPVAGSRDVYAYGLLPPRFFDAIMTKIVAVWSGGQGTTTPRD